MEALVKFSVRSINNLCFRGRNDFIRFMHVNKKNKKCQ